MILAFDLKSLVAEIFHEICEKYQFSVVTISSDSVALCSVSFIILIGVDRDGVYLNYFDKRRSRGHDLISFLLDNRRSMLTFSSEDAEVASHKEYVRSHLEALAKHLLAGGQDILAGDDAWEKDSRYCHIEIPESLLLSPSWGKN